MARQENGSGKGHLRHGFALHPAQRSEFCGLQLVPFAVRCFVAQQRNTTPRDAVAGIGLPCGAVSLRPPRVAIQLQGRKCHCGRHQKGALSGAATGESARLHFRRTLHDQNK